MAEGGQSYPLAPLPWGGTAPEAGPCADQSACSPRQESQSSVSSPTWGRAAVGQRGTGPNLYPETIRSSSRGLQAVPLTRVYVPKHGTIGQVKAQELEVSSEEDEEIKEEVKMGTSLSRVPTSRSGVLGLITQVTHRGDEGLKAVGDSTSKGGTQVDGHLSKDSVFDLV